MCVLCTAGIVVVEGLSKSRLGVVVVVSCVVKKNKTKQNSLIKTLLIRAVVRKYIIFCWCIA